MPTKGPPSPLEDLRELESEGFRGQFIARAQGMIECRSCGAKTEASRTHVKAMERFEGESNPSDMCVITAIECPECGTRGTGTFCYGAGASPEDAEVLRKLDQHDRHRQHLVDAVEEDDAFVRDTGWLTGPDRG